MNDFFTEKITFKIIQNYETKNLKNNLMKYSKSGK